MTPREFVYANRQCAINRIPVNEMHQFAIDHFDLWSGFKGRTESFMRELNRKWQHGVSLRFFDGKLSGYYFDGCYSPGSHSWDNDPVPRQPVVIDYSELMHEAGDTFDIDFELLL